MIQAYAAMEAGGQLKPFEYDPGPLKSDEVEIAVEYCGICHSDLSMLHNEWGNAKYPLVPGHEAVGKIVATGDAVARLKPGDRVGLGWFAASCLHCRSCLEGDHNLCTDNPAQTIVGRHGAFANRVRCQELWAVPVPDTLDAAKVGPLFCGGLTVFNPILQFDVKPTHSVGVIGVGGLGHLALQFLKAWGCHVTAFSSSGSKFEEARKLGAHSVVNSTDSRALKRAAGTLDFLLVTANVPLDWNAYLACLKPRGRMHFVGAVLEPIPVPAFALIGSQKSVSGSPLGSPRTAVRMLEFCALHNIAPVTETFPIEQVNEALAHLEAGKGRHRVVLEVGG
ncbi:MAG: NAD(P)-dependent alcohol dehydrogenase [Spirochaetales bacterium]|nr:NAD(P)-dependent alcohol dehydrogenase [Leptospiraceae bacterium]MCP5483739.1 NAD(P)-dependent alcohol dehydrogenase [Spirochaetales bacterium]MCP5484776.1 NAD(P)-dependent alcohol dehydrogenase [Spirochaetales bacterium]